MSKILLQNGDWTQNEWYPILSVEIKASLKNKKQRKDREILGQTLNQILIFNRTRYDLKVKCEVDDFVALIMNSTALLL
ncbi:hypothetical protein LEP1GSC168_2022 [Leptospira santarosai str. HAI134]|uniref:Uncharacterized protein n=1 Tax=Leptospira santarosai str. ZUN179 TaxID=1049985 RepID=M6ULA7_9LEPT|nr:hypothetical protein LEP1GSC168_2022 [Leptospira santarosai str. HAI134]EMO33517.1 hypothetical protein LEP1GSC175_2668 [Leptospira santarosai str. HAI821]EMO45912.1 hypothetical protein LEP1GSC187_3535 [Leptospira santarosai str. ZUN179]